MEKAFRYMAYVEEALEEYCDFRTGDEGKYVLLEVG